jgi:hypothetical protein
MCKYFATIFKKNLQRSAITAQINGMKIGGRKLIPAKANPLRTRIQLQGWR